MALTLRAGTNIVSGSITLAQYRNGVTANNEIGVGYWYHEWQSYDTEGHPITRTEYVGLRTRYKFRVSQRCSAVTIKLEYSAGDGAWSTKQFAAAVYTGSSQWTSLTPSATGRFSDVSGTKTAEFTVNGTFETGTDYYLYVWSTEESGGNGSLGTRYNTNSYGDLTATISAQSPGLVHIDSGTQFNDYTVWIDNGTAFEQYVPYIDNGTTWVLYS